MSSTKYPKLSSKIFPKSVVESSVNSILTYADEDAFVGNICDQTFHIYDYYTQQNNNPYFKLNVLDYIQNTSLKTRVAKRWIELARINSLQDKRKSQQTEEAKKKIKITLIEDEVL